MMLHSEMPAFATAVDDHRAALELAPSRAAQLFSEGKRVICLYTDLSNPYSNRSYAKIGFKQVCLSFHHLRKQT